MTILNSDLQNTIEFATKLSALLQEYNASVRYNFKVWQPPRINCEGSNYDLVLCDSCDGHINIYKDLEHSKNEWVGCLENGKDFNPVTYEEEKSGSDVPTSDHPDDNLGQQDFSAPDQEEGEPKSEEKSLS